MTRTAQRMYYIDIFGLFCDERGLCGPHVPGTSTLAIFDYGHLTQAGALYMSPFLCTELRRVGLVSAHRIRSEGRTLDDSNSSDHQHRVAHSARNCETHPTLRRRTLAAETWTIIEHGWDDWDESPIPCAPLPSLPTLTEENQGDHPEWHAYYRKVYRENVTHAFDLNQLNFFYWDVPFAPSERCVVGVNALPWIPMNTPWTGISSTPFSLRVWLAVSASLCAASRTF